MITFDGGVYIVKQSLFEYDRSVRSHGVTKEGERGREKAKHLSW